MISGEGVHTLWSKIKTAMNLQKPLIALFNNLQTLKFKAKVTITFYAAVNHYRNGHPKAETSKVDRNLSLTNRSA